MEENKSLRDMFLALDTFEQEAVTTFFNLHNASIWIYNNLSLQGVVYCNEAIAASMEVNKVKSEPIDEFEISPETAAKNELKKEI